MASLLVLGLVLSGIFSTIVLIFPNFPTASILCMFLSMFGFAITFTIVSWLPKPAKLSNAETLTFFGNNLTASLAVPSKIIVSSEILSISRLDVSKNFAPFSDLGCLVVVMVTESNSFLADLIASMPDIAPDGR